MATAGRVLIVGAGLAGLVAALRLERANVWVTVLEQADRVGGRLAADTLEGMAFEPSCPVVPASSPELFGLLSEIGLADRVRRFPIESALLGRAGRTRRARVRVEPGRSPWARLGTRRLRVLLDAFGGSLDARRPERGVRLDDRSVADFARLYLGRAALEQRFAPLLEAELGFDARETSRLLLLLHMNAFGDVELARCQGLGLLPEEIAKRLREVRTATCVEAVHTDGRGVRLTSGEELEADTVLVATRADQVGGLVSTLCPGEQTVLSGCGYTRRLNVAVALAGGADDGEIPERFWNGPAEGGSLASLVDVTPDRDARSTGSPRLLLLVARPRFASERWHEDDPELVERMLGDAARVVPGLQRRVLSVRACRLPEATPRFDVGHYRGIARLRGEQLLRFAERRTLLCGDYLVAPHAEGAAVAGTRAAGELLRGLSQPDSPATGNLES